MAETPDMTQGEMVEILKAIARDGSNGAARIAAIKELKVLLGQEQVVEGEFEKLYAVESPRLRTKAA